LSAANKPAEFFVTFLCAKEKLDKKSFGLDEFAPLD
jgi:hypothetical protein